VCMSCRPVVDLTGMDASWNSSQWVSVHRDVSPTEGDKDIGGGDDDDDDDCLPQLDGLTDNKSTTTCYLLTRWL